LEFSPFQHDAHNAGLVAAVPLPTAIAAGSGASAHLQMLTFDSISRARPEGKMVGLHEFSVAFQATICPACAGGIRADHLHPRPRRSLHLQVRQVLREDLHRRGVGFFLSRPYIDLDARPIIPMVLSSLASFNAR
jgi:hypothetical protein